MVLKFCGDFYPDVFDQIFYTLEGPAGMIILLILVMTGALIRIINPHNFYSNWFTGTVKQDAYTDSKSNS